MPRVHMPDGKIVNFPDGMSAQDISKAMDEIHAPAQESAAPKEEKSIGGFLGNVMSSGGRFLADSAKGLYDTARFVGDVMPGADPSQMAARRQQVIDTAKNAPRIASVAGQALKNRYGGLEQIGNTLYNDPVGVAADVSMLLDPAAGLAKAGGLAKTAGMLAKGAELTNPLRAITEPVAKLAHEAGVTAVRGTLRAPASVRDEFGGSRAIAEGVLNDRVYSEASSGRKLAASREKADRMVADAQAALAPGVDPKQVAGAVMGAPQETAKLRARLGVADSTPDLEATAQAIVKNNGAEIPLTEAQTMKREAQDLAYEAGVDNNSVKKAAEKAKAQALRQGIEDSAKTVGIDVAPVNEQTQRLIGSHQAFKVAEDRPRALTGMMSILGGLGGFTAGGPAGAIAAPALMQLLDSPRAGALTGIAADSFGHGMNAKSLRKAALVARLLEEAQGNQ